MDTNEEIENLLRRAAVLRLLAAGFLYPGAELKQRLLQDIAAIPAGDATTAHPLAALERAWAMADEDTLTEEYSRLYIGGDAVLLQETAYCNTSRTAELADINGFYLAFGFDLREDQREVSDHLGMELEFYSLLLLKQAYALEQGWPDKFSITRDAAKAFLADHLGRWPQAVRERAAERQAAPIYQILFETVTEAVQRECQVLGVQPAPLNYSGPDFMQAPTFICPMEQAAAVK